MNPTLDEFIEEFKPRCAKVGISFNRWAGSRHPSLSIVELVAPGGRALAYIKVRNSSRGFWGLNPNQLRAMEKSTRPWCLVLLHGTDHTGFFIPSSIVKSATGTLWHTGHDTEFKVNENTVVDLTELLSYAYLHDELIKYAQTCP